MDTGQRASAPGGTEATTGTAAEATVTVRYWAGARAAAGVDSDVVAAGDVATLAEALVALRPGLRDVLPVCTVLVDGRAATGADALRPGADVEVLPPFAGG
ncbi:MoaD/ThiS family protein [Phycicoccus sp. CSK15P-2]|uniref:MoaD/ThiS family protein n=1 Tax=Phycicoccus sp. CSK15P-2 TaxID=2807627 RepID=UPI0019523BB0|nr:MoaD/ThiS family protein [Phycicoccus sp. CSK15P-2]MBM6403121.1 MoaD/ThiS family protein [Phycicoccus sp. CSK15P-2]